MAGGTGRLILIGIPSFRRPAGLSELLESLSSQKNVDDLQIQVFVADNDAQRREAVDVCTSLAPAYRWPLAWTVADPQNISAARNAILSRARQVGAEFIAMIDDDEIAAPDWLFQILAAQKRHNAGVVGGPMHYWFDSDAPRGAVESGLFVTPDRPEGILPIIYGSPNVLIDCRRLAEIQWPQFDLRFGLTGGEDREFFVRLRNQGIRFAWAPNAKTFEPVPKSRLRTKWILRRAFSHGNTDMRIWQHHGQIGAALLSLSKALMLLACAPLGAILLFMPSRRLWMLAKWSRSLGKLAALFGQRSNEYATNRITGVSS